MEIFLFLIIMIIIVNVMSMLNFTFILKKKSLFQFNPKLAKKPSKSSQVLAVNVKAVN